MPLNATTTLYHVAADDIPLVSMTNKCVVLDLDKTLVSTQEDMESLKKLGILSNPKLMSLRRRTYYDIIDDLNVPGEGTRYPYWGITRPHVQEFLIFCFSYFQIVAVWTAGQRYYGEKIVDHIFKDIKPPHVIFTHDDIEHDPDGNIIKPLTKMYTSNPLLAKKMTPQNTFVIDDTNLTFSYNQDNAILIPPYDPPPNVNAFNRDDHTLPILQYWLLRPEVVHCTDVRTLDKTKIFNQSLSSYKTQFKQHPGYNFNLSD
jgi:NLI interacting factor-like phosphatase